MQQKNKPFELAHVQMHTRELAHGVYAVMATDVDETDHRGRQIAAEGHLADHFTGTFVPGPALA